MSDGTIEISGLTEAKERGPLDSGTYSITIGNESQLYDNNGKLSLGVMYEITEGQTQQDDSEPEGRKCMDFFQLTNLESHSDGGDYARGRLATFLRAADVDVADSLNFEEVVDEIKGAEIVAYNQKKKNKQTKKLQENWSGFEAAV